MNITPNTIIQINNQHEKSIPTIIPAELIEIPPHTRTLKVNQFPITSHYCQIPYTQFYFTEIILQPYTALNIYKIIPLTLISNTKESVYKNQSLQCRFSNCTFCLSGGICWGAELPAYSTKNELISQFWNTRFDYKMFNGSYEPDFNIEKFL